MIEFRNNPSNISSILLNKIISNGLFSISENELLGADEFSQGHITHIKNLGLEKHKGAAFFLIGSTSWGLFNSIKSDSDLDLLFVLPSTAKLKEFGSYLPGNIQGDLKTDFNILENFSEMDGLTLKILEKKISLTVLSYSSFLNLLIGDEFSLELLMLNYIKNNHNYLPQTGPSIKRCGVQINRGNERLLKIHFKTKECFAKQIMEHWFMLFLPNFFYFGNIEVEIINSIEYFKQRIKNFNWDVILKDHYCYDRLPKYIINDWSKYLEASPSRFL